MSHRVLLISSGTVHPNLLARWRLYRLLSTCPEFEVEHAGSIEAASRLASGGYRAAIVYLHRRRISPDALAAVERFVSGGGGLLGVHSATASFKQVDGWFDLLGGRFAGHGKPRRFEVEPCADDRGPFGDIGPFAVHDELYVHDCKADITVHFSADLHSAPQPVVWTRRHGGGRVAYVEPGHCAGSLRHPAVRSILVESARWACG